MRRVITRSTLTVTIINTAPAGPGVSLLTLMTVIDVRSVDAQS